MQPSESNEENNFQACYAVSMLTSNWESLLGFPLDD